MGPYLANVGMQRERALFPFFSHHKSPIAAISTSARLLLTLGRDRAVAVYRKGFALSNDNNDAVLVFAKVLPVFEEANCMAFLDGSGRWLDDGEEGDVKDLVAIGGAGGCISVWDVVKGRRHKVGSEV